MGGVGIGGNYPKEASKLLLEAAADARLGLGVGGGGIPGGAAGAEEWWLKSFSGSMGSLGWRASWEPQSGAAAATAFTAHVVARTCRCS